MCSGNTCRSPLVEGLLRTGLAGLPVTVRSAGTSAAANRPMSAEAQRIAVELGVPDAAEHRSRRLTIDDIRSADLVLALTRSHRRSIRELLPSASRRVFTLREFGRLAAVFGVSPSDASPSTEKALGASWAAQELPLPIHSTIEQKLPSAIELVTQSRGHLDLPADPRDDDVIDPFQRGRAAYARSTEQLLPAVEAIVGFLRRASRPDHS
ncbi:MAG: low molecular weight phosphatase family protein [Actinobacteria bacterium]|nr:low molecular weight phosphatase family protein [Actinomycetota bacterium]